MRGAGRAVVGAVLLASLCAGCGVSYPAATVKHDTGQAEGLLHALAAGQDAVAEKMFGAKMRAGLPAPKLAQAWDKETARYGAFQSMGTATSFGTSGALVVDVPLHLAHGSRVGRVSFDPQGQVIGLFFLK